MGGAEADARVARSPYDVIAELYDPSSRSVVEDVPFYVAVARAGGPAVELGAGLPLRRADGG